MARSLAPDEKLDWLQLYRSVGIGPVTFFKLLKRFGSARRAFEALPKLAAQSGDAERFRRCRREEAEAELDGLAAIGAQLIACGEPSFPARLAEIADPPPLLTVLGDLELLSRPGVALVGARNASANGRMFARALAGELAGGGVVVISGLARGIDTAAHEGTLQLSGPTVAVIASGIDVAYPTENAQLMRRIAETGAVVTERPLGREPQARHFPRRNRLIAGLSLGVVVVEAAPQSGSLITARLAAEQGREVMAVPGSPLDPRHRGTNQLLRDGATLVESALDVRAALGSVVEAAAPSRSRRVPPGRNRAPAPLTHAPPPATGLAEHICERLSPEPLLVDELIRECGAGAAQTQEALLELEMEGRIERHPGNRVSLAAAQRTG